jgi:autotransporter-associated beta strand protein
VTLALAQATHLNSLDGKKPNLVSKIPGLLGDITRASDAFRLYLKRFELKSTKTTHGNLMKSKPIRSSFPGKAFPCAITLSLLAALPAVDAADGTWTGGTSATWATGTNWADGTASGGTAANADIATFNSSTYSFAPTAVNNYFVGGLSFGASNTGSLTLTSGTGNNRLNVGSSGIQMTSGSGPVIFGVAAPQGINVTSNQAWTNNSAGLLTVNRVAVDDLAAIGTYTLTINGSGTGGVTVSSNVADLNNAADASKKLAVIINSTGGATNFANGSTYSGGTTLTAGLLQVGGASTGASGAPTSSALGTGSLALNGGTLSSGTTNNRTVYNTTTIGGNVTLGDVTNIGVLTFDTAVGLTGGTRTLTTATGSGATFSGIVSNGGITKLGAGTLTLSGASANTYTGLTTASAGNFTLAKTSGDAIAGNLLVNGGNVSVTVAGTQIADTATVEVSSGSFTIGSLINETVATVKLTGGNIIGNNSTTSFLTATTAFDLQSGTNTAILAGAAGATKTTGGTVLLSRASTYSGGTTLTAGTLQIDVTSAGVVGAITSSAIGTGSLTLNGGTISSATAANNRTILNALTIGGNVTLGDATNTGTVIFSADASLTTGTRTLTTAAGSGAIFSGSITNGSIIKEGAGTLALNGNSSTVAVTANSGTLAGTGTVGATTIETANLAVGGFNGGIGTMNFSSLSLGSASSFIYQMSGGGIAADLGDIAGALSIDTSSILDLVELGTYTLGNKFTLFAYDGALSGNFNGLANNASFLDDLANTWQIKYDDATAGLNGGIGAAYVTVTAIPEPGAALLGGLGMLVLLRRRSCA